MPDEVYALRGPTKDRLSELLRDYGHVGGPPIAGSISRGVTWVKVTGAISGGWFPGVVSLDQAGSFTDLTTPVNVQSADGSALTSGNRYLCTRTGDSSGGVAQFRTISPTGGGFIGAMIGLSTVNQALPSAVPTNVIFGGVNQSSPGWWTPGSPTLLNFQAGGLFMVGGMVYFGGPLPYTAEVQIGVPGMSLVVASTSLTVPGVVAFPAVTLSGYFLSNGATSLVMQVTQYSGGVRNITPALGSFIDGQFWAYRLD